METAALFIICSKDISQSKTMKSELIKRSFIVDKRNNVIVGYAPKGMYHETNEWFLGIDTVVYFFESLREVFEKLVEEEFMEYMPDLNWPHIEKTQKINIALTEFSPFSTISKFVSHHC